MSSKSLRLLVNFATSDNLSGPLKRIVGLGESGSQKLGAMERKARELGQDLRNVQGELKRSTGNVTQLLERERQLTEQIERTNLQKTKQARINQTMAQADAMRQHGADLRASGTGMMMTGAAMAAPGFVAGKQAMSFESAMADVRKVVDFDTPEQFQQMGDDILDLSTRIPMASEGLAGIVASAARARVARKDLLTFAEDAAEMGVAFDTTAEEAGDMMAKWRTSFKLGQDDVRGLADQVNALTNTYGGNVTAVSGIVTRIGALGDVAGVSAPQIAALGQVMDSVGVAEEVSATGIKNMMLAMTKGEAATKSQQKALAALGLDSRKLAIAMQDDAGGAIVDLLGRLRELPEAGQAATLTQLFGSESVAAIAPLVTNLDRLKENFALVGDEAQWAGSMHKEYLSRVATTEGATGLAGNALKALNITLGQALLPTIQAVSARVVIIANRMRGWAKEHPGLAKGLVMAGTALALLVTGIGALTFTFGMVLGPLGTFIRLVTTGGPMLISVFNGLRFASLLLAKGVMRAGVMMMANPIVLVITAIVAALALAGYLIWTHWDTISGAFKAGVAWVKDAIGKLPEWLRNLGGMMMDGLLTMLTPGALAKRMVTIAKAGITAFKDFFGIKSPSRLMMGMGGHITDGLAAGIERGKGTATRAARAMATGVAGASMVSASVAGATGAAGNGGSPVSFGPVEIHIHAAPGMSAEDIAEAVQRKLEELAEARRRSGFSDQD